MLLFFIGVSQKSELASAYEEGDLLRLHIIANSDSKHDQEMKLKVRDKIIERFGEKISEIQSAKDAEEYIKDNIELITDAAYCAGFVGDIDVQIGNFEFPDRVYGGTLLPAGTYRAVKVVLGKGMGQNWWCVMYPPLCFSGEEVTLRPKDIRIKSYIHDFWLKFKMGEIL